MSKLDSFGILAFSFSQRCTAVQRAGLDLGQLVIARLDENIVEDRLRLREIPLVHVSICNADLNHKHALTVAEGVSNVGSLRVGTRGGVPVSIAAG
jgi:hypothetical protein